MICVTLPVIEDELIMREVWEYKRAKWDKLVADIGKTNWSQILILPVAEIVVFSLQQCCRPPGLPSRQK